MGCIADNTYALPAGYNVMATDSSLSGNGFDAPIGLGSAMRPPVVLLWSGHASSTTYTAKLNDDVRNYEFLDLWGSGNYVGQTYNRIPVVSPWTAAYERISVFQVTPAESNQARYDLQPVVFPTTTSFSAGSARRFGMGDGTTTYNAALMNPTSVNNTRLTRIYGVGYGKGV